MAEMTARDLRRAARLAGATVVDESSGRWRVYQVEAPLGEEWLEGMTRFLRVEWRDGDAQDRHAAIADAIERMGYGCAPIPRGDDRWLDIEEERERQRLAARGE